MPGVTQWLGIAAVSTALLAPLPAEARLSGLDHLFVFGDSVLDGGNAGLRTAEESGGTITFPSPPYADGRFSNGPTSVEYLWNRFNPGDLFYSSSNPSAPFRPSLAGGTNFAIGGASSGVGNNNGVSPDLKLLNPALPGYFENLGNAWQRDAFDDFIATQPGFDPATSLFVIELFPNDVLYFQTTGDLVGSFDGTAQPGPPNIANPPPAVGEQVFQQIIANAVTNIVSTVVDLYEQGARNILVFNSTDLGRLPAAGAQAPTLTLFSDVFNTSLDVELDKIRPALTDADLQLFDFYGLSNAIYADPNAFSLDDTMIPCTSDQDCLDDPEVASRRIFWDPLHPTTALYKNVGQALYNDVVEKVPAPLPIVGIGVAFGYSRKLRKRINDQKRFPIGTVD
jgi:phospholipase/lecithinase/hemolysin